MTPFYSATVPAAERERILRDTLADYRKRPEFYAKILAGGTATPEEKIAEVVRRAAEEGELFMNETHAVRIYKDAGSPNFPALLHLSIKRLDREPIHDWRELQEIKNLLVGEEHEAVELYPAESRCVDSANQYHLFALADPNVRFPFGFVSRFVDDSSVIGAKQRPGADRSKPA